MILISPKKNEGLLWAPEACVISITTVRFFKRALTSNYGHTTRKLHLVTERKIIEQQTLVKQSKKTKSFPEWDSYLRYTSWKKIPCIIVLYLIYKHKSASPGYYMHSQTSLATGVRVKVTSFLFSMSSARDFSTTCVQWRHDVIARCNRHASMLAISSSLDDWLESSNRFLPLPGTSLLANA